LLVEWNDTRLAYPREKCIHHLFEEQVERSPDSVALVFEDERLTYRELNSRANQLAQHLQSLGVGPEILVAICVERSPDMVVGLLGVLKAGGAYLPLDPDYPRERLAFMLEDAQVSVLLTTSRQRDALPAHTARVVCLDADRAEIARQSDARPRSPVSARNLAYVLFTSGSTGRPKGVAIEHRSASAMLHWVREVFPPQDLAGMLASTSLSFDLAVFELFGALSWGGCVFLAQNALQFPTMPAAQQVTLINTVPSAISQLLRSGDIPPSVRTVNLAGEPLLARVVDQLYEYPSIQRVFDLYGPSEDTTYSTFALRQAGGAEIIGRPVHNTRVYLLDEDLQPVSIGAPGELYLGGDGLARGYLNRPALTAGRFIPNPFAAEGQAGTRLYKTGDLARYRPDGNLQFIGRVDHQVKLRGFRVELGEIEAALRRHPALKETVVLARQDAPGEDKRLVAYIVPEDEASSPSVSELRDFLRQGLPDYMLPSAFVALEALPLTPNAKIDRAALPAPPRERPALDQALAAPRSATEKGLLEIWELVLQLQGLGIYDNFFELGGHSLLATQVTSHMRDVFQVNLPLRTFFQGPTIAELAQNVETAQGARPAEPALTPLSRSARRVKRTSLKRN
jgi:amino acid adenylation domain-containing protein